MTAIARSFAALRIILRSTVDPTTDAAATAICLHRAIETVDQVNCEEVVLDSYGNAVHSAQGWARKSLHSPGTPFSECRPRSLKLIPDPATRSRTVLETSTSLGAAADDTRAPIWTAIPPRSSPISSHSPV